MEVGKERRRINRRGGHWMCVDLNLDYKSDKRRCLMEGLALLANGLGCTVILLLISIFAIVCLASKGDK